MSAGRPSRSLADLQAEARANEPTLDTLPPEGAFLAPRRSLADLRKDDDR